MPGAGDPVSPLAPANFANPGREDATFSRAAIGYTLAIIDQVGRSSACNGVLR
jgi:hypothetical protein